MNNTFIRFQRNSNRLKFKRNISTNSKIDGILPPICTPFKNQKNEPIAWKHLENNLKLWERIPFKGYVVHGSNGEYPFLTTDERIDLVHAVRESTDKNKIIIAGASAESLKTTLQTCESMAKKKADYVLILPPSFYKNRMTDAALFKYFTEVADRSPLPVIIYNMPANTTIDITFELCIDLASHPNIVAMKDSGGNIPKLGLINQQLKQMNNRDFSVIAGSAGFLLDALKVGCTGGICALANVLGSELIELYENFLNGKLQEAEIIQKKIIEPNTHVTRLFGVAALKASLDASGFYGGPVRVPLLPLNEDEYEKVKNSFTSNGFPWSLH